MIMGPKPLDIPVLKKYKKPEQAKCIDCIHHRTAVFFRGANAPRPLTCGIHGGYWNEDNWCCDFERAEE